MAIQREQGLITELLLSRDMPTVVDNGINASYLNGKYRRAYKFIIEHQSLYGKVPTISTFKKKFKDCTLASTDNGELGTGESLKYWCDQVREKKKHNIVAEDLEVIVKKINEEMDTEGAYDIIKKLVLKVEQEVVLADRSKINENTEKRKEDYLKRQKSEG